MNETNEPHYSNLEEELKTNGVYVSTTVGYSMMPMLRNRRDRVVLRAVNEERLRRRDLPLYRRPDGKYVLHRILAVKADHYVIRGDNTYVKERVPFDWVKGVMTEFYRGDRHVFATSKMYRAYAAIWNILFPVRFLLWRMRAVMSKIKHAWKKK